MVCASCLHVVLERAEAGHACFGCISRTLRADEHFRFSSIFAAGNALQNTKVKPGVSWKRSILGSFG
eukprot:996424-Pleurochrysis_carterae.AAC.3